MIDWAFVIVGAFVLFLWFFLTCVCVRARVRVRACVRVYVFWLPVCRVLHHKPLRFKRDRFLYSAISVKKYSYYYRYHRCSYARQYGNQRAWGVSIYRVSFHYTGNKFRCPPTSHRTLHTLMTSVAQTRTLTHGQMWQCFVSLVVSVGEGELYLTLW